MTIAAGVPDDLRAPRPNLPELAHDEFAVLLPYGLEAGSADVF
jgi:hypothetical protein